MTKNLVIVESPAKARTIERYLGADYKVLASYGHVRDLPESPGKGKFGVDVDHDFEPEYVVSDESRKHVASIAREAKLAETVYLATDLDREGEAIAWHVAEAAHVPASKTQRVTFSEITEDAIREAFRHSRGIDMDLVDAQQTRRIVDRLVGYTLSPLLSRKVRGGLSAGRVQSVAVRLVVDREREIRAFTAREFWTLEALLATGDGATFAAEVNRIDDQPVDVSDGETASAHADALRGSQASVSKVGTRTTKRNPSPPFTTSTLQQEASRKLGFNPRRTMRAAQSLYEGVDTPEGHLGLITYMRTDSTAMAGVAVQEALEVVRTRFGAEFATPKGRIHKTKAKGAQEAHESIRPTSFRRDPESLARDLGGDELKLYRLIWQRALASQMAPKEVETSSVDLVAGRYGLRASASRTVFEGFARVYTEGRDDEAAAEEEQERQLPPLRVDDVTQVVSVDPVQHFTEPPPRFTEASLIKALEEHGIGRPSTYAATITTIVDRGYVVVRERRLHPEIVGEIVTDLLVEHFGDYVDLAFTARMEEELDEVARGEREWVPLLRGFYGPLKERVDEKRQELKRSDFTTEESDEVCSEGHPMVIRLGRNGRFLACSMYPQHKETRPLPGEEAEEVQVEGVGEPCPECGLGHLTARRGRFGVFAGCDRYPECKYIKKTGPPPPEQLPFEVECPKCGKGHLVARRARRTGTVFWGCSEYPKCDLTSSREPLGPLHDTDAGPIARNGEEGGICLRCGAMIELPAELLPGARLAGDTQARRPPDWRRPNGRGSPRTACWRPSCHEAGRIDVQGCRGRRRVTVGAAHPGPAFRIAG
jgi:DNA topoisomerase-1